MSKKIQTLLLIGPASSVHIVRWANSFVSCCDSVHLITLHEPQQFSLDPNIRLYKLKYGAPIGYFFNSSECKQLVETIKPDLINAHYATGYGFLASSIRHIPTLISVWGSDIYDFPNKSPIHKWLLKYNLQSATAVASTSSSMAREVLKILPNVKVFITPFGIDTDLFLSQKVTKNIDKVVIGTVKTLEEIYGVDLLILAFAAVVKKIKNEVEVTLEITGEGSQLSALQDLVMECGLSGRVKFNGQVAHNTVVNYLNRLDIYVALSRFESFGVAILEASACELPVVVSDADGPAEVTINDFTGYVVPRGDVIAAERAIIKLIQNPELRKIMGTNGRSQVIDNYSWNFCVNNMLTIYRQVIMDKSSL